LKEECILKEGVDHWSWKGEHQGRYTLRSPYKILMNLQMTEEEGIDWCNLWNCYVPAKVTTFVWKLLQNRIPTKDNLAQRGVIQQGDKM